MERTHNKYKLSRCINTDEAKCQCELCSMGALTIGFLMCAERFSILLEQTVGGYVPLRWTSLCRCPEHNTKVGGVKNSDHCDGDAGDVKPYYGFNEKLTPAIFHQLAQMCFGYVKQYNTGRLHCSARLRDDIIKRKVQS